MTQSIPTTNFQDIRDPNDIVQGSTMEARVYYRDATKISFIEKSTGNELIAINPEVSKEIRRRIALGEVEEKIEPIEIATTPLPADAWHMNYYVKKGLRLWPKGKEPNQESQDALLARIKELEAKLAEPPEKTEVVSEPAVAQEVNRLACQVKGCSKFGKPFNTFLGLARHMSKIHNQK